MKEGKSGNLETELIDLACIMTSEFHVSYDEAPKMPYITAVEMSEHLVRRAEAESAALNKGPGTFGKKTFKP